MTSARCRRCLGSGTVTRYRSIPATNRRLAAVVVEVTDPCPLCTKDRR